MAPAATNSISCLWPTNWLHGRRSSASAVTVITDEGYAFFQRFPDRTIDEADITARIPILANFIETVLAAHNLTRTPIVIGFSNGATMAAALLLNPSRPPGGCHPVFGRYHRSRKNLTTRVDGTPVLILDGENDSRRSPGDGLRLAERLIHAGATVTHHVLPVGHSLSKMDREIAREWLGCAGRCAT